MKITKAGGVIALILATSLLVGCGAQATPAPTADVRLIYTQAVETVNAQNTNAAKLTPRATNTPVPTETPTLAATRATVAATGTSVSTTPIASLTPISTTSGGSGVPSVPDKMVYVSQSVADGSVLAKSEDINMRWVLKNTGTTTWNDKYSIRFYAGQRMGAADFSLKDVVQPGETTTVTIRLVAPATAGNYTTWWVISNPDLVNFGSFNFAFEVK